MRVWWIDPAATKENKATFRFLRVVVGRRGVRLAGTARPTA